MQTLFVISVMVGTSLAAFSFPSSPQIEDRFGNGGPDNYGGPIGYGNVRSDSENNVTVTSSESNDTVTEPAVQNPDRSTQSLTGTSSGNHDNRLSEGWNLEEEDRRVNKSEKSNLIEVYQV